MKMQKTNKRCYPNSVRKDKDCLLCAENKVDSKSFETYKFKNLQSLNHALFTALHLLPGTSKNIKDTFLKHWHILQSDPSLKKTKQNKTRSLNVRGQGI